MPKFNEMPMGMQALIVLGAIAFLSVGAYFGLYKSIEEENARNAITLKAKQDENDRLRPYAARLDDLNRQIATLKDELEQMKKIVPDEKLADQFIHLMQDTAAAAGIDIRRYSTKQMNTKEFYSEAPYEMELDGPYYAMMNFFDKVSKLDRIINVSGLRVANVANGGAAGARRHYNYTPNESVVATCTTTTFFSRDNFTAVPAAGAPAKK